MWVAAADAPSMNRRVCMERRASRGCSLLHATAHHTGTPASRWGSFGGREARAAAERHRRLETRAAERLGDWEGVAGETAVRTHALDLAAGLELERTERTKRRVPAGSAEMAVAPRLLSIGECREGAGWMPFAHVGPGYSYSCGRWSGRRRRQASDGRGGACMYIDICACACMYIVNGARAGRGSALFRRSEKTLLHCPVSAKNAILYRILIISTFFSFYLLSYFTFKA